MKGLGYELVDLAVETDPPKGKPPWETINTILASLVALSTLLLAPWDKHPRLTIILLVIAFLLVILAFRNTAVRWYEVARARNRRGRFAHAQFPELVEFAKRFGKFVDSGDGKNLRNILFYGCGNNQDDFDKLCTTRDYFDDIWPHFFTRLQRIRSRDEVAFCNIVRELVTLVSSYNQSYVLDPLKRIDAKIWPPVGRTDAPKSELVPWLVSLSDQHRANVKKQIKEFQQRWGRYLDDLELFLNKVKDHRFNCPRMISDKPTFSDTGQISFYFERPAQLD